MIHEKNEKISMSLFLMGLGGFFALLSGGMTIIVKLQQLMLRAMPETEEVPEVFPALHGLVLEHMPRLFGLAVALAAFAIARYFIKNETVRNWSLGLSATTSLAILLWMVFYSIDASHFARLMDDETAMDVPHAFEVFTKATRVLGMVFVDMLFSSPLILHLVYFAEGLFLSKRKGEDAGAQ